MWYNFAQNVMLTNVQYISDSKLTQATSQFILESKIWGICFKKNISFTKKSSQYLKMWLLTANIYWSPFCQPMETSGDPVCTTSLSIWYWGNNKQQPLPVSQIITCNGGFLWGPTTGDNREALYGGIPEKFWSYWNATGSEKPGEDLCKTQSNF